MRAQRGFVLLAVLLVTACSGAPTSGPTVQAFAATPSEVATGDASTLTWVVSGTEPITLTITPGVGDVTGATQVVVHPTATTTYTLTATNAAGTDSDHVSVGVADRISVRGTVVGIDDAPAAGVTVAVPGRAPVTSDAGGGFGFDDVVAPYRITTYDASNRQALTYVSLTTDTPTLVVLGRPPGTQHDTSVYGTVQGGAGFPEPANHVTRVSLGAPGTRSHVRADPATGGFSLSPVVWFGEDTIGGSLHTLQWRHGSDDLPIEFTGYGARPITLRSAIAAYLAQDVSMTSIPSSALSGTTTVPPGYALATRTLSTWFADGARFSIARETSPAGPFWYVTPLIGSAEHVLAASATGPDGETSIAIRSGLDAFGSGVTLDVPVAAQVTRPPEGATGITTDSLFSWSTSGPRIHLVSFQGPPGEPTFRVLTDATSVQIPNLESLGMALPRGTPYTWQLTSLEPFDDIDASTRPEDGLLSASPNSPFYLPVRDIGWAVAPTGTFTTAP